MNRNRRNAIQHNPDHFGSIDTVIADQNSNYHNNNIDRLLNERNGFFNANTSSNKPLNLPNPPTSFGDDNFFGEITGKYFEADEIEQGMPMRTFDTNRPSEQYSDPKDYNPHLDFQLYQPQSGLGANVKYNDPLQSNETMGFGFLGNQEQNITPKQKATPLKNFPNLSNNFTLLVHQNLKNTRYKQSFGTPSFSILLSLMSLYRGSTGYTEKELSNLFQMNKRDSFEILMMIYPKLNLSSSLKLFNSILVSRSCSINPNYREFVKKFQFTDYYDSKHYVDETQRLNKLIRSLSQNTVKKMLPDQTLRNNGIIVCSSIYCKPFWRYQFNSRNIVSKTFNGYPRRSLNFMTLHDKKFLGCEDNSYQLIELDLFDPHLGMGFLISKEERKINISDKHFYMFLDNLELQQYGIVQIPKIETDLKFKYNLSHLLSSIGLNSLFSSPNLDDAFIGKKARVIEFLARFSIVLSEKGKEIPTIGTINNYSNTSSFLANKPFLFYLRERSTNTLIFIGEYY